MEANREEEARRFADEVAAPLARAWVYVGTEDLLPVPRAYLVHEAGGRSLLICRDDEGELGAFVNACSHRGTRLCRQAGVGRLRCPYHGWVFDTSGRLLGASDRKGLPPFDDAELGLARVALARVGPFLFAREGQDPALPSVGAPGFGEPGARLRALGALLTRPLLESKVLVARAWTELVPAALHELSSPEGELSLLPGGHSWDGPRPGSAWERCLGLIAPAAAAERGSLFVFPNLLVVHRGSAVEVTSLLPRAPSGTLVWTRLYDSSPARSALHPRELWRGLARLVAQHGLSRAQARAVGPGSAGRRGDHFLAALRDA
ncbi:MAG: aromatic ring-hydroxylating dioxygenase subunit alpha [Planctomycetota bacterium]